MKLLDKKYSPSELEDRWYNHWLEKDYFSSKPSDNHYTIVIPPPNVTGKLTMGHVLNNTIQDILIRKARMEGKNACWVPGTDHASIATESKVAKMLQEKGIDKKDISREEFLEHAWEWKEKYGGNIINQLQKLGCSSDWKKLSFTMDKKYTDLEKQNKCAEICIKSDAEYMGIQYGYQCFCSKKKPKDDKESEKSIEMCGMGGNKCFKSGQCSLHNAVFRINNKYEHKKTPLSDRCKNYFLFDKIIDNDDDDKDKVGKDAKLNVGKKTLYDMCPKQCGVTTDECPN